MNIFLTILAANLTTLIVWNYWGSFITWLVKAGVRIVNKYLLAKGYRYSFNLAGDLCLWFKFSEPSATSTGSKFVRTIVPCQFLDFIGVKI